MSHYAEIALVRGMHYLAESQATVAHNLANVDSTGFRRRVALARPEPQPFAELLDARLGAVAFRETTDWSPGSLRETGNSLHVAIEGPGFFAVQDDGGRRLFSRNGELSIDPRGRLTDIAGRHLLDVEGKPLRVDVGERSGHVEIAPDGSVRVADTTVGRLGVFRVADPAALHPAGQSAWLDTSGRPAALEPHAKLRQGQLERSNVDALDELVRMISIQRSFEATTRALSTLGRLENGFMSAIRG